MPTINSPTGLRSQGIEESVYVGWAVPTINSVPHQKELVGIAHPTFSLRWPRAWTNEIGGRSPHTQYASSGEAT